MSSAEKRGRRKFTPEFKTQAVKRVQAGHTVTAVARELGIADSLLHTWVTQHHLQESNGVLHAERAAETARLKRALTLKDEEATVLKNRRGLCQRVPVKHALIEVYEQWFPVTKLCRMLEVPRSGYYARQGPPERLRHGNNRRLDRRRPKSLNTSRPTTTQCAAIQP